MEEPGDASGASTVRRSPTRRKAIARAGGGWGRWFRDPRSAVLIVLAALLVVGGGRRWLQTLRARRAADRLAEPDVSPEDVLEAAKHGREGLLDLFRLLGTSTSSSVSDAAGAALSALWKDDELIPEEEKAIVSRGFSVHWRARRRYPRGLQIPIPLDVSYGIPFLREGGNGVSPANLEWSHRIVGAGRASLEKFSPWTSGPGRATFEVEPADFTGNGPHRLVLHLKTRTRGLTSNWELELPQVPFSFDFDPYLAVDALLSTPDSARGATVARAIRLEPPDEASEPGFLPLGETFTIRNPPFVVVDTPLPSDLSHDLSIELENVPGAFPAGQIVVTGQGAGSAESSRERRFPIGPISVAPSHEFLRPGSYRLRAQLAAVPERGWTDPDIRSIWPGTITTDWVGIELIRR
jgi:hypothetical protein